MTGFAAAAASLALVLGDAPDIDDSAHPKMTFTHRHSHPDGQGGKHFHLHSHDDANHVGHSP